jgi:hypothetical protein
MLGSFFQEVVIPIKGSFQQSYKVACETLGAYGDRVFDADTANRWRGVLAM